MDTMIIEKGTPIKAAMYCTRHLVIATSSGTHGILEAIRAPPTHASSARGNDRVPSLHISDVQLQRLLSHDFVVKLSWGFVS